MPIVQATNMKLLYLKTRIPTSELSGSSGCQLTRYRGINCGIWHHQRDICNVQYTACNTRGHLETVDMLGEVIRDCGNATGMVGALKPDKEGSKKPRTYCM